MTPPSTRQKIAPRFILASGSPRRRILLRAAEFNFEVATPAVDEFAGEWLTIGEITSLNSMRKALAVSEDEPKAVVLGADTLVTFGGRVIGKPADLDMAAKILRQLSGRAHEVWTSVFVCHGESGRWRSFQEISRVHFRKLDQSAISNYLAKINPLDKAGAYAAQGHGREIIEGIEGSYTNVVGLPMEKTIEVLREFGVVAPGIAP